MVHHGQQELPFLHLQKKLRASQNHGHKLVLNPHQFPANKQYIRSLRFLCTEAEGAIDTSDLPLTD